MSALPNIPRPWRHKWTDFRLRGIPPLVLASTLVAIVLLWNHNWMPATFIGEVHAPAATVASPQVGLLAELHVTPFAPVRRGQPVAVIQVVTPEALQASATAIQSELEIMRARMILDQNRNLQNHDRLRLDWLSQRVDLAVARASLGFAENEFQRVDQLFREQVASDTELEIAQDRRDALRAEVEERTRLVNEFERTVVATRPASDPHEDPLILGTISTAIAAHEAQLRQLESPIRLDAPIDGIVTAVYRRRGETVMAGEPLVVISGDAPDQIIGYVRQPMSFEPQTGDTVEVRTRGPRRQTGLTRVNAVGNRLEVYAVSTSGSQLEVFAAPLGLRPAGGTYERGLPVLLDIPANMRLIPGELVDLIVRSSD
jgi:multidrug resistance efflux pump